MPQTASRQLLRLKALYRLTSALTRASALADVYEEALTSLYQGLEADRSSVLLFDPDGVLRFKAWRGLSDPYRRAVEGHSPWSRDTKDPAPILVPDVLEDEPLRPFRDTITGEGIRALAFVPLVAKGKLLGKFMLYYNKPHEFTEDDVRVSETIAAHVAFAVERARGEEELQRGQRRLAAEHAVTRILAESHSFTEAAPRILQAVGECLGCTFAAIWRPTPDERALRCLHIWHPDSAKEHRFAQICRDTKFERGSGLPGRVWETSEAVWLNDLETDRSFPRLRAAAAEGLRSGFAFPILTGRRFRGLLEFFLPQKSEPDPQLLTMMTAIGSEIGQFIEQKRAELALRQSEAWFRHLAETVPEILFVNAADGSREYVSPRFFEYTGEDPEGHRPDRFEAAHPDDREDVRARFQKAMKRAETFDCEFRIRRKDGAYRWFHVRSVPILDESGKIERWFGVAMDVNEQKLAQERLQDASRAKDDFLAMLAHELRNPLNPIRNAVHVMRLVGPEEAAFERSQDIIERQVRHMTRLIDDLLDVSRIAHGKILLKRERLDLTALVRSTIDDHKAEIEARGIRLTLELPSEPLWVSGDPTRLAQVVGNLLHNANKFTSSTGEIRVRAQRDAAAERAVVSVRDTGIGMEPEILGRVFETFTQAEQGLDRSGGGLGLGLPLVKGFVQLHGGSVHAESEGLGRGAEFSIRLPLDRSPAPAPKAAETPSSETATCRVLLIEDNTDSVESTRLFLALAGHEVDTAYTGSMGIARARECRPDVVLCDIGLQGGLDGYAVARALRWDPQFTGTYLVAITGYGREDDIRCARDAGFDLHLTKPVDPVALKTLLSALATRLPAMRG